MRPFVRIIQGDVRPGLRMLPDRSVHMAATSPPYWGLRDYGLPPVVWGGDRDGCQHDWEQATRPARSGGTASTKVRTKGTENFQIVPEGNHAFCRLCGAWRGSFGNEPQIDLYVSHLVEVFREVRRVLRDDGTLWLNLGDSYANDGKWGGMTGGKHAQGLHGEPVGRMKRTTGLKPKDLCGIPWRVALALQADGWWWRSTLPWLKRGGMPDSTRDRPGSAVEYVLLFSKSSRYYFDSFAVRRQTNGLRAPTIVQGADHVGKSLVCSQRLGAGDPPMIEALAPTCVSETCALFEDCVRLATAILQSAKLQNQFSLAPFDPQIRQELLDGIHTEPICRIPVIHRAALCATAFLNMDVSPKDFLHQIDSLGIALAKTDVLGIDGGQVPAFTAPTFERDGDAAIRIDDASQVSQSQGINHCHIAPPTDDQEYIIDKVTSQAAGRNFRNCDLFYDSLGLILAEDGEPLALDVNPHAFKGAHFATWPPALVAPMVKASTSERGACSACGGPWRRITGHPCEQCGAMVPTQGKACPECGHVCDWKQGRKVRPEMLATDWSTPGKGTPRLPGGFVNQTNGYGWHPSCTCNAGDPVATTILDPFFGAGTTGLVAAGLGRNCIGIELKPEYCEMARARITTDVPPLADVTLEVLP